MMVGIRDIPTISTPEDLPSFKTLLKDGSQFEIKLTHAEQPSTERFGIIEFIEEGKAISIVEKSKELESNYATTAPYLYDNSSVEIVKK